MPIMLTDAGAVAILTKYFQTGTDHVLHLFCTDVTPVDTDVLATYTPAAGGGYASKTLTAANFVVSVVADIAQVVYAEQSFIFTGPLTTNGTVYGYYVTDASATVIYSERLDSPFTPTINGDTLSITLKFQLSKGVPA